MDRELLDDINSWMEYINDQKEGLKWQKYLTPLPDRFFNEDPRGTILISLSWLLSDMNDCRWPYPPRRIAELLNKIGEAISDCTETG